MLSPNSIIEAARTAALEQELYARRQARFERGELGAEPRERRSLRLSRLVAELFTRRPSANPARFVPERGVR
jgi:hypothetical protein